MLLPFGSLGWMGLTAVDAVRMKMFTSSQLFLITKVTFRSLRPVLVWWLNLGLIWLWQIWWRISSLALNAWLKTLSICYQFAGGLTLDIDGHVANERNYWAELKVLPVWWIDHYYNSHISRVRPRTTMLPLLLLMIVFCHAYVPGIKPNIEDVAALRPLRNMVSSRCIGQLSGCMFLSGWWLLIANG